MISATSFANVGTLPAGRGAVCTVAIDNRAIATPAKTGRTRFMNPPESEIV
jgi:hypothetical protein